MKRIILKWLYCAVKLAGMLWLGLILLIMVSVSVFTWWTNTDRGGMAYLEEVPETVEFRRTEDGMRYAVIGDESKPPLVLVHGGTGGLRHWKELAERTDVYDYFHLLIPERPGYGATGGRVERDPVVEAERLLNVLEGKTGAVVVGISYGGAPTMMLGWLAPEQIRGIVGAAGVYFAAYNPEVAPWLSWVGYPPMRWIIPQVFRASVDEYLYKPQGLDSIEDKYREIEVPVVITHGTRDGLVSEQSSVDLDAVVPNSQLLLLPGMGHRLHDDAAGLLVRLARDLVLMEADGDLTPDGQ